MINIEVLVISKSFIIREAMDIFLKNSFEGCKVELCKELKEIEGLDLSTTEFLFIDVEKDIVNYILQVKQFYKQLKVIVFNKTNSKNILSSCFENKIESCICDVNDKDDLIHIINTVKRGKKYYDLDLLEDMINEKSYNNVSSLELLTDRENEVLDMVGLGLTNKEIAKRLYITEHTVKKHITSILSKLDMRNRKELIIYRKENNTANYKLA
ncbi:MAG: response regulator transcription factor [Paraclostridium sp.]